MNKRQAKKVLKQMEAAEASLPTVDEAFESLWGAINRDPEWKKHRHCLFISFSAARPSLHAADAQVESLLDTEPGLWGSF